MRSWVREANPACISPSPLLCRVSSSWSPLWLLSVRKLAVTSRVVDGFQLARIAVIQARTARLADSVALFAALGGGWRGEAAAARDTITTESN